LFNHHFRANLG